jgi:hypothetical protein
MSDSSLPCTNPRSRNSIWSLPFTHATSWTNFQRIVKEGFLRPSLCPIFKEELVYFFCGSVAHRASDETLRWGRSESPIILVFDPATVTEFDRMFPLDTGALVCGRLGAKVNNFRTSLRMHISNQMTPWRLISAVYGSVDSYSAGILAPNTSKLPKLQIIGGIINENAQMGEVDYRRFSVECQSKTAIPLAKYLRHVWIPCDRNFAVKKSSDLRGVNINAYPIGKCPNFFEHLWQPVV